MARGRTMFLDRNVDPGTCLILHNHGDRVALSVNSECGMCLY